MDRIYAMYGDIGDIMPHCGTIISRGDMNRRNECPNLSCKSRYTEYCYCPEYLNKRMKDGK